MDPFKRILVTGAKGFLGHHIVPRLTATFPGAELIPVERKDYDLLDTASVKRMFTDIHPDVVIHLAAKSGGILDNRLHPADYFHQNMAMNLAVFHEAFQSGVKKFLSFTHGRVLFDLCE